MRRAKMTQWEFGRGVVRAMGRKWLLPEQARAITRACDYVYEERHRARVRRRKPDAARQRRR
jgi:hypothetical protein